MLNLAIGQLDAGRPCNKAALQVLPPPPTQGMDAASAATAAGCRSPCRHCIGLILTVLLTAFVGASIIVIASLNIKLVAQNHQMLKDKHHIGKIQSTLTEAELQLHTKEKSLANETEHRLMAEEVTALLRRQLEQAEVKAKGDSIYQENKVLNVRLAKTTEERDWFRELHKHLADDLLHEMDISQQDLLATKVESVLAPYHGTYSEFGSYFVTNANVTAPKDLKTYIYEYKTQRRDREWILQDQERLRRRNVECFEKGGKYVDKMPYGKCVWGTEKGIDIIIELAQF